MLSLEEKLIKVKADLNRKGITSEQITEVVKNCTSDEQRINALQEHDFNPFTRPNKIKRGNGSQSFSEGAPVKDSKQFARILRTANRMNVPLASAARVCGINDFSESEVVALKDWLKKEWRSYTHMTESEAKTLAERLVEVPRN